MEPTKQAAAATAALYRLVIDCGGQKAAAVKLGCSPQFVGQMVHGQRPIPESLYRKLGLRRREIVEAK